MIRFLLTLWVIIFLAVPGFAQDKVFGFEEDDLPILNEELRKINGDMQSIEGDITNIEGDITIIEGYGNVLQIVYTQTGTYDAGGIGNVPDDTSIPQVGEFNEWTGLRCAIASPASATSILSIDVSVSIVPDASDDFLLGLWSAASGDTLACTIYYITTGNEDTWTLSHRMLAGSTDARTFRVGSARIGGNGTVALNSKGGATKFGGTFASNVTVTEYMN